MLNAWGDHPAVRETLAQASDVLGEDVTRLIAEGPKDALDLTTNTQPVMLAADIACYRAWLADTGQRPQALAGHSLGEYAAWVAAEVLSFDEALPLVRFRAQAMQEAVPAGQGGMAAILGLEAAAVREICERVAAQGDVVEAVNFNDPKQTVIAGSKEGVNKACEALKAAGAKRALPLPVSAPFHSSLMRPAAERLKARLQSVEFKTPAIPVINNIDVAVCRTPEAIRDGLYRQAFGPVRWVETVQALRDTGLRHVFECGPGKVLAGMIKRIDPELITTTVLDPASVQEARNLLA